MNTPRMRMVAGPNGSGKSTLLNHLRTFNFALGHWLNPDEIEVLLRRDQALDFRAWNISPDPDTLRSFVAAHPLVDPRWAEAVEIRDDKLTVRSGASTGYLAAVLSDFLRRQWVASGQSFTFETVMSSPDKVGLLSDARHGGFRTYLYYICTDSPLINRERVAARVAQGGHDVPASKLEPRYRRSLSLLPSAIEGSDRAYLFDNSADSHVLVAEFEQGRLVRVSASVPEWFVSSWLSQQSTL